MKYSATLCDDGTWMVHTEGDILAYAAQGNSEEKAKMICDAMNRATEKRAPVQGYKAGIPWSMHLRAYDAYCKRYGRQDALIDLEGRGCRGGFGVSELDMFIPGWREELSEITALKAEIAALKADRP